jgi:hypothetical protein
MKIKWQKWRQLAEILIIILLIIEIISTWIIPEWAKYTEWVTNVLMLDAFLCAFTIEKDEKSKERICKKDKKIYNVIIDIVLVAVIAEFLLVGQYPGLARYEKYLYGAMVVVFVIDVIKEIKDWKKEGEKDVSQI